jgi:hypothetical protein
MKALTLITFSPSSPSSPLPSHLYASDIPLWDQDTPQACKWRRGSKLLSSPCTSSVRREEATDVGEGLG